MINNGGIKFTRKKGATKARSLSNATAGMRALFQQHALAETTMALRLSSYFDPSSLLMGVYRKPLDCIASYHIAYLLLTQIVDGAPTRLFES